MAGDDRSGHRPTPAGQRPAFPCYPEAMRLSSTLVACLAFAGTACGAAGPPGTDVTPAAEQEASPNAVAVAPGAVAPPPTPEAPDAEEGVLCATETFFAGTSDGPQLVRPLIGPFAELADYCACLVRAGIEPRPHDFLGTDLDCGHGDQAALGAEPAPFSTPPFLEVGALHLTGLTVDNQTVLAIRVQGGWYVQAPDDLMLQPDHGGGRFITEPRAPFEVRDVLPGGGLELVYRYETMAYETAGDLVYGEDDAMLLCGVGPSGVPACARLFERAFGQRRQRQNRRLALEAVYTFDTAGADVVLSGPCTTRECPNFQDRIDNTPARLQIRFP